DAIEREPQGRRFKHGFVLERGPAFQSSLGQEDLELSRAVRAGHLDSVGSKTIPGSGGDGRQASQHDKKQNSDPHHFPFNQGHQPGLSCRIPLRFALRSLRLCAQFFLNSLRAEAQRTQSKTRSREWRRRKPTSIYAISALILFVQSRLLDDRGGPEEAADCL